MKKFLTIIFVFSLLFTVLFFQTGVSSAGVSATDCYPSPTNLALGHPAYASSVQGVGYEPDKAVDGDLTTRWSSTQSSHLEWFYVDLEEVQYVEQVVMRWEGPSYPELYEVLISNDGVNWELSSLQEAMNAGVHVVEIQTETRFIMMNGLWKGHTGFGYSLWEYEVYEEAVCEPPAPQERPPDPVPGPNTLFFDDFEDGADPAWNFISGTWQVEDGVLITETPCASGIWHSAVVGDETWTDYEVQFDFMGERGSVKTFQFRYTEPTTLGRYIWAARSLEHDLTIGYSPTTTVKYPIRQGVWYRIRITVEGEHIQLFIDDVLVIDRTDVGTTRLSGGVGPVLGSGTVNCPWKVQYDNILVNEIVSLSANANGPYQVYEGDIVSLIGSAEYSGDLDILYQWDLDGDGEYDDATGMSPEMTWWDDGIYPIGLKVTDEYGHSAIDSTTVTVVNVPPTIDEITAPDAPILINQPIELSASFHDPGNDEWTALWNWGDDTSTTGTISDFVVQGIHSYDTPGIYTVELTIFDDDNGEDSATYEYLVVYDPASGFVTGAGLFDSPAGAYYLDETLIGKVQFRFVSMYNQGTTIPTGNTGFSFKVADIKFDSTGYEWLVVFEDGSDYARFKGTGTINGEGEYKFMIWAGDGETDTFRIKIWEEDEDGNETVIYDNGFDQEITGGNIVIHEN